jgi:hypothetical protein
MDQDGVQITAAQISTPGGDYAVPDIRSVEMRTSRPLYGPLFLAILGTVNLTIAVESRFWLDFVAAGVMLVVGVLWRVSGTKYVLTLELPSGKMDVWFARREPPVQKALEILRHRVGRR